MCLCFHGAQVILGRPDSFAVNRSQAGFGSKATCRPPILLFAAWIVNTESCSFSRELQPAGFCW
jgi:hypothetical protein